VLEVDEVRDQHRAPVIAAVELRGRGLRWQRRKGVAKRLGFDPAQQDSEGEEEAVAAGRAMRERQRARFEQVPDLPDRYDPTEARPPSRRSDPNDTRAKLRRVRLPSNSEEVIPSESSRHPLRIDSDSASERQTLAPYTISQRAFNRLFGEETQAPLPVERSGASQSGQPQAAPTAPLWRRRISSDDESTRWRWRRADKA
jgi:hypothetical protein